MVQSLYRAQPDIVNDGFIHKICFGPAINEFSISWLLWRIRGNMHCLVSQLEDTQQEHIL